MKRKKRPPRRRREGGFGFLVSGCWFLVVGFLRFAPCARTPGALTSRRSALAMLPAQDSCSGVLPAGTNGRPATLPGPCLRVRTHGRASLRGMATGPARGCPPPHTHPLCHAPTHRSAPLGLDRRAEGIGVRSLTVATGSGAPLQRLVAHRRPLVAYREDVPRRRPTLTAVIDLPSSSPPAPCPLPVCVALAPASPSSASSR